MLWGWGTVGAAPRRVGPPRLPAADAVVLALPVLAVPAFFRGSVDRNLVEATVIGAADQPTWCPSGASRPAGSVCRPGSR